MNANEKYMLVLSPINKPVVRLREAPWLWEGFLCSICTLKPDLLLFT